MYIDTYLLCIYIETRRKSNSVSDACVRVRLSTLRDATVRSVAKKSWGLADASLEPPESAIIQLARGGKSRKDKAACEKSGQQRIKRVPQQVVRVREGDREPTTSLESLARTVAELGHCDIGAGTKRALVGGGGDFSGCMTQMRHNPRLVLPGGQLI